MTGPDDGEVGSTTPAEDEEVLGGDRVRTDLSWNRSGLALTVAAAAILKVTVDVGDARARVVIVAVLVGGLVAWLLTMTYGRYVARPALAGQRHGDEARIRSVATVTVVFALGATVIALLPPR